MTVLGRYDSKPKSKILARSQRPKEWCKFLVAHSGREEAKKKWHAMRVDPEFQEVIKSEQANKLVEKVDLTYMRPTDFSPIKWSGI